MNHNPHRHFLNGIFRDGAALSAGLGLLCLVALALSACRKEPRTGEPESSYDGVIRFSMSVEGEEPDTRFLVGTVDDADFIKLTTACNIKTYPSTAMGIGLWADYYIPDRPDIDPVEDIYKFNYSKLQYSPDAITAHGGDPKYGWVFNTADDYKYWALGGQYVFRAFYPFSEVAEMVHKDSNGELFMVNYSSKSVQEDILVACREINTHPDHTAQRSCGIQGVAVDPSNLGATEITSGDYGWYQFDLSNTVRLDFRHVLSAIRFKFEYAYESEGVLREFWFENVDKKGFCTEGTMSYGNSSTDPEKPSTIHNFRWNAHQVDFHTDNEVTNRFYYWKFYSSGNNMKSEYQKDTVWVNSSNHSLGYTAINKGALIVKSSATPYTCALDPGVEHDWSTLVTGGLTKDQAKAYHDLYTKHNGWLLVPPQEVDGKNVLMCFTTGVLTEPVEKDLFNSIDIKTYVLKDENGAFAGEGTQSYVESLKSTLESEHPGKTYTMSKCLLPGYKYEITVKLTPTNVQFGKITIEPWKNLLSSEEIIF